MKSLQFAQRHLCLFIRHKAPFNLVFFPALDLRHRSPLRKPIRAIEFYFYCLKKSSHACARAPATSAAAAGDRNPGGNLDTVLLGEVLVLTTCEEIGKLLIR